MGDSSVFNGVNTLFQRVDQFLAQQPWWVFWVVCAVCAVIALIQFIHHRNMYNRYPKSMRAAVRLSNVTSVAGVLCLAYAICLAASKLGREYVQGPAGIMELLPVILTGIAFLGALIAISNHLIQVRRRN